MSILHHESSGPPALSLPAIPKGHRTQKRHRDTKRELLILQRIHELRKHQHRCRSGPVPSAGGHTTYERKGGRGEKGNTYPVLPHFLGHQPFQANNIGLGLGPRLGTWLARARARVRANNRARISSILESSHSQILECMVCTLKDMAGRGRGGGEREEKRKRVKRKGKSGRMVGVKIFQKSTGKKQSKTTTMKTYFLCSHFL